MSADGHARQAPAGPSPTWRPRLPGPDALGRSLVVVDRRPVHAPWNDAQTIAIGDAELADAGEVLVALRAARQDRRRVVVELTGAAVDALDPRRRPVEATTEPPRVAGARYAFDRDELWHLVWSNSVDGRHDETSRESAGEPHIAS
ncbi:MAG: hypothetical protein AAFY28_12675 [Actinomycetota bacterium]